MKMFLALVVAVPTIVGASESSYGGSMMLLGVGTAPTAAPNYQGPGDVFSGATAWGSCARVYTAAQASTATSLCDLTAKVTQNGYTAGGAVCTIRATASGYVDLAASYCNGTTPALACGSGGSGAGGCRVGKIYDQTGNGNHFTNATPTQQPSLVFSSLNGLPGLQFLDANSASIGTAAISIAQPYTMSAVVRIDTASNDGAVLSGSAAPAGLTENSTANTLGIASSTFTTVAATDGSFYALQGLASGSNCAVNLNASDTAALNCGVVGISSSLVRWGRQSGGPSCNCTMMEAGVWALTSTAGNRNGLGSNQRNATYGYNF
jgi:hypothetical protein